MGIICVLISKRKGLKGEKNIGKKNNPVQENSKI